MHICSRPQHLILPLLNPIPDPRAYLLRRDTEGSVCLRGLFPLKPKAFHPPQERAGQISAVDVSTISSFRQTNLISHLRHNGDSEYQCCREGEALAASARCGDLELFELRWPACRYVDEVSQVLCASFSPALALPLDAIPYASMRHYSPR